MNKQEIKEVILKNIQNNKFKDDIRSVSLFGSYALNNETETSDIDILIDFKPKAVVGFLSWPK